MKVTIAKGMTVFKPRTKKTRFEPLTESQLDHVQNVAAAAMQVGFEKGVASVKAKPTTRPKAKSSAVDIRDLITKAAERFAVEFGTTGRTRRLVAPKV